MRATRFVVPLGLLAAGACTGRGYIPATGSAPARPKSTTAHEAGRFTQRAVVPVVLMDAEGSDELDVEVVGSGVVTFRRSGEIVWSSQGRARPELRLEPLSAESGLRWAGRTYPGILRVEAREAGGLRLVNEVDLEDYVEGVVSAELSIWSAHSAELEAQAIAVRSYGLCSLGTRRREVGVAGAFLWDSVEDQSYKGRFDAERGNAGSRRAGERLRAAIETTRGLVLMRGTEIFDARFHAACGGHTSELDEVFLDAETHGAGVPCEPCEKRSAEEARAGEPDTVRPLGWSHVFERADLDRVARELGVGAHVARLAPGRIDAAGRWLEAQVAGDLVTRRVPSDDLRRALGFTRMKSALVGGTWPPYGKIIQNGLQMRGLGRGHGVGLCQEGARDYAAAGSDAAEILAHYYPGVEIDRLPAN